MDTDDVLANAGGATGEGHLNSTGWTLVSNMNYSCLILSAIVLPSLSWS